MQGHCRLCSRPNDASGKNGNPLPCMDFSTSSRCPPSDERCDSHLLECSRRCGVAACATAQQRATGNRGSSSDRPGRENASSLDAWRESLPLVGGARPGYHIRSSLAAGSTAANSSANRLAASPRRPSRSTATTCSALELSSCQR